jgi:3-oxoacyl-[acyl-carrier-protein] synthase-1
MNEIPITGVGAVSPVGLSAPTTAAALRAGIARLGPLMSTLVDAEAGTVAPAVCGRAPLEWLAGGPATEEWPGYERFGQELPPPDHLVVEDGPQRLARLAAPAAVEAWRRAGLPASHHAAAFGLFVGFGERETAEDQAVVIGAIRQACDGWTPRAQKGFALGRASALHALHHACREIRAGRLTGALVGGVDSLIRPSVYATLEAADAIKNDENPQGILPGEGAAFLVLDASAKPNRACACLAGIGVAEEPTSRTGKPNQAEGLSAALRAARNGTAGLAAHPLSICDLNGDRYRAIEWGFARARALSDLGFADGGPGTGETWHPADCLGDTGAGSCAICVVWAVESMRLGYALTPEVLVWGASDGPLRAAGILVPAARR